MLVGLILICIFIICLVQADHADIRLPLVSRPPPLLIVVHRSQIHPNAIGGGGQRRVVAMRSVELLQRGLICYG